MATSFPTYSNSFVPAYDQSAKLVVGYSRNWKEFPVNRLCTISPVDKPTGYYLRLKPEALGRNINSPYSYAWPDGQPCPIQVENAQDFDFVQYYTQRYAKTFPVGYNTEANAVWDIVKSQSDVLANQMMTMRAMQFYSVLGTSGNYTSSNTDTATNLGGGFWSAGTSTNRYIQKTLMAASRAIIKNTMNGVKLQDLVLVIGPTIADAMARSAEIADYVAQSPDASKFLEFDVWNQQNRLWGLPSSLYGIQLCVDETVEEVAKIGGTSSKSFVQGDANAFLITKQGALSGQAGGSAFSSIHMFTKSDEEMALDVIDDPLNKRRVIRLVDTWQFKLVAQESAYLITNILS